MTMLCVKELCVTMLCVTMLWMAPSTTPATQSARSCHQVPRVPQKAHVHVTKCVPATQSARPCDQVPRLPRHKLRRQTHPSGSKCATRTASAYACHAKCTWMAASTTPATQSERSCHQAPRLPCTRAAASNAPKRVQARYQNHSSAASATPATHSARGWHQVPRRSCDQAPSNTRQAGPSAPPEPAQCRECHACHAKCTWMAPSTTPGTQSARSCVQAQRLPRKRAVASNAPKRANKASPAP